ncbi:MAG: glycerophosphodiester phosphodiesterase [Deltaproteobacteria bacterium]|nr:glycerophosphodiester phosphodiesterase [Deltaproteobacteria bacterium]MBW2659048.1 glycerophosphodiester phosphodiesterase [Deltaproteobacteria bacterium]
MTNNTYSFDSQGHRGARGLSPENSLVAFARALSIGVTTLELDLCVTADNIIVITHNYRLEPEITRKPNGEWLSETGPAIRSLTLKELRTYDVGRMNPEMSYQADFPEQVAADGTRIPTFEELFNLIHRSGNDSVRLNIEAKLRPMEPEFYPNPEEFIAAILKIVRDEGFMERVTIQSFDWRALQETQRQAPNIPTAYLTVQQEFLNTMSRGESGLSPWHAGFDIDTYGTIPETIKAAGGSIWSSFHREVSSQSIKQAHNLGLEVKVWSVNEMDRMETLINMGVDGIITDYPDRLRQVLKKLGMILPAQTPVSP